MHAGTLAAQFEGSLIYHLHLESRLNPALYSPSGQGAATPRLLT